MSNDCDVESTVVMNEFEKAGINNMTIPTDITTGMSVLSHCPHSLSFIGD